jgi:hypothetical protein
MDLSSLSRRTAFHAAVAVGFIGVNTVGFVLGGGLDFVQGWGGGLAAAIATWFLVFKSQGYWAWMIVNAALWTYLFFHVGLPMLAYLQISFLLFAGYGMVQWAIVRTRVGFDPGVRLDLIGSTLAIALCAISIEVYWTQPGYRGSLWWWLEFGSVLCAIAAMWMDAFRYRANWIAWTVSNAFSAPLFWHGRLWGPFWTIFLYQALNCVGWFTWTRDQRGHRILQTSAEAAA